MANTTKKKTSKEETENKVSDTKKTTKAKKDTKPKKEKVSDKATDNKKTSSTKGKSNKGKKESSKSGIVEAYSEALSLLDDIMIILVEQKESFKKVKNIEDFHKALSTLFEKNENFKKNIDKLNSYIEKNNLTFENSRIEEKFEEISLLVLISNNPKITINTFLDKERSYLSYISNIQFFLDLFTFFNYYDYEKGNKDFENEFFEWLACKKEFIELSKKIKKTSFLNDFEKADTIEKIEKTFKDFEINNVDLFKEINTWKERYLKLNCSTFFCISKEFEYILYNLFIILFCDDDNIIETNIFSDAFFYDEDETAKYFDKEKGIIPSLFYDYCRFLPVNAITPKMIYRMRLSYV